MTGSFFPLLGVAMQTLGDIAGVATSVGTLVYVALTYRLVRSSTAAAATADAALRTASLPLVVADGMLGPCDQDLDLAGHVQVTVSVRNWEAVGIAVWPSHGLDVTWHPHEARILPAGGVGGPGRLVWRAVVDAAAADPVRLSVALRRPGSIVDGLAEAMFEPSASCLIADGHAFKAGEACFLALQVRAERAGHRP